MTRFAEAFRRFAWLLFLFVVGTAVFSAAYCQAPLYYSNQNQYFLHGLAEAGCGSLRDDWLARTQDSTPLFSALVAFTVRYLHPWAFYFYFALLLGAYGAAMLALFVQVVGEDAARRRWPIFLVLFVAVHAALPRWCSYQWLGQDYPWFLQSGLAGQYILGSMFQPSMFGVLLIVSIALFVRDRPYAAAVCAATAAVIHSTYLLPAGMVVLGFLAALVAEGRLLRALKVGVLALAIVLPSMGYVLLTFHPTTASTFSEAQAILVNIRIPHHTRPDLWLDTIAMLQMLWVVLALFLARPVRFRYLLAVPSLLALLLTLAQVATRNDTLALLFPWRISSVLVPLGTTVILSRLVGLLPEFATGAVARVAAALGVAVCAVGGVWISAAGLGFRSNDDEQSLLKFVHENHEAGDVYFLPVNVPILKAGSLSSDFKPLADKQRDARVIPVDLQRFRLVTGVPIFVDFKSIPYKDVEVLEWYARLRWSEDLLKRIRMGEVHDALAELRDRGITHLVLRAEQELESDGLEIVHEDAAYRVYRLSSVRE